MFISLRKEILLESSNILTLNIMNMKKNVIIACTALLLAGSAKAQITYFSTGFDEGMPSALLCMMLTDVHHQRICKPRICCWCSMGCIRGG